MSAILRGALFVAGIAGIAGVAEAQAPADTTPRAGTGSAPALSPAMGTWTIAPFVGTAHHSPSGYNWGTTPDRNHFFLGVHFATPIIKLGPATIMYAGSAIPLVVVSNNPKYTTVITGGVPHRVESGRGPVVGAGLVPFGLQVETPIARGADLYINGGIGGAWFTRPMPRDGARKFNFSLEFGGGLYLMKHRRTALNLGYKFHHFSNMYTARENPGLDGHVLYAGVRWRKQAPRE